MVQKLDLSKYFDPKDNKLPKKTGIGGKLKPIQTKPLFDPSLVRNPTLKKSLATFNPTNPAQIRDAAVETLRRSVDTINRHLEAYVQYKGITFEVNQDAKRTYAVVRDQRSGEVLKQIPAEGVLQIAANLRDASGIVVSVDG